MKTMIKVIFIGMGFISYAASFCVNNPMQWGNTRPMGLNRPTGMPFGLSERDKLGMSRPLNLERQKVSKDLATLCNRHIPTKEVRDGMIIARQQDAIAKLHAERINDLQQSEERQRGLLQNSALSEASMLNQAAQEQIGLQQELLENKSVRSQLLESNGQLGLQNSQLQNGLKQKEEMCRSQGTAFRRTLQEYIDDQRKN